ncbi:MAG: UDP-N-acetylglucosamine--N-acetylmuramyl-(pentapeptide) pyrophosphoryl-undecaprenol N-acetylglucosamine transferase [Actinomycetota bacterium]|nr:UDP-N-acetylglucosamine--N-acetylmuramyl-(pentapeptide) pyrophosphoryl-undecaprenol N-acetylglucosamine transferase [Actinomycetota bacterium]
MRASGLSASDNYFKKVLVITRFLVSTFIGFFASLRVLMEFKPHIILGMGGYVCAPVLLAAMVLRKRFMLHEQNYIPGRLNRFFSRYARKVFISFRDTKKYFPSSSSTVYSGNPVRKMIRNCGRIEENYSKWGLREGRFTIIAFGGSLGAGKLNSIIMDLYNYFKDYDDLQILLITGKRFYEDFGKVREKSAKNGHKIVLSILPYIQQMDQIYRIADLVISRAGANTIAELITTGIPAILIPYPYAVENHQYFNAKFMADNGKAILITEKELSSDLLIDNIRGLIEHNKQNYNQLLSRRMNIDRIDSHKVIAEGLVGS